MTAFSKTNPSSTDALIRARLMARRIEARGGGPGNAASVVLRQIAARAGAIEGWLDQHYLDIPPKDLWTAARSLLETPSPNSPTPESGNIRRVLGLVLDRLDSAGWEPTSIPDIAALRAMRVKVEQPRQSPSVEVVRPPEQSYSLFSGPLASQEALAGKRDTDEAAYDEDTGSRLFDLPIHEEGHDALGVWLPDAMDSSVAKLLELAENGEFVLGFVNRTPGPGGDDPRDIQTGHSAACQSLRVMATIYRRLYELRADATPTAARGAVLQPISLHDISADALSSARLTIAEPVLVQSMARPLAESARRRLLAPLVPALRLAECGAHLCALALVADMSPDHDDASELLQRSEGAASGTVRLDADNLVRGGVADRVHNASQELLAFIGSDGGDAETSGESSQVAFWEMLEQAGLTGLSGIPCSAGS